MCTSAYATAKDFGDYFCSEVRSEREAVVNRMLNIAAARIHAARQASGQCDCTLASWASTYLMELNVWIARYVYNCPCSSAKILSNEEKSMYLEAIQADLQAIRESKIELCAGETGADFPVTGWADQGVTEFARARIIANSVLRGS
jgi:hypothetical protein